MCYRNFLIHFYASVFVTPFAKPSLNGDTLNENKYMHSQIFVFFTFTLVRLEINEGDTLRNHQNLTT